MPRKSKCSTAASTLGSCSAAKRKPCKKAGKRKAAKKAPKKKAKKKAKKRAAKKPAKKVAGKRKAARKVISKKAAKKKGAKRVAGKKAPKKAAGWRYIRGEDIQPSGTAGRRYRYRVGSDDRLDTVEFQTAAGVWRETPNLNVRGAIRNLSQKSPPKKAAKRTTGKKASRKKAPPRKTEVVEQSTITPHPRSRTVVEKTTVTRPMTQAQFDYYKKLTGGD